MFLVDAGWKTGASALSLDIDGSGREQSWLSSLVIFSVRFYEKRYVCMCPFLGTERKGTKRKGKRSFAFFFIHTHVPTTNCTLVGNNMLDLWVGIGTIASVVATVVAIVQEDNDDHNEASIELPHRRTDATVVLYSYIDDGRTLLI